jgi:hypothetical protein
MKSKAWVEFGMESMLGAISHFIIAAAASDSHLMTL